MLPPVYLWILIVGIIGLTVRKPLSARISMGVLIVGRLLALGTALLWLNASFHCEGLRHPTMLLWSVGAIALLTTSHVWSFWRLVTRLAQQAPPTADA
ncbi:hypothetical protein [Corallococcus sp. AB038B]|uniref:hypothetical protein n=1 Tax=Corallococcus sp. AB038B TaxID=2316718 RepID=UPI0011C4A1B5|nr:hypothetical protein [Corallococcus sp. AB038B]